MQETSHPKSSHSRSLAYNWCRLIKFCRITRPSAPSRGSKDSGMSQAGDLNLYRSSVGTAQTPIIVSPTNRPLSDAGTSGELLHRERHKQSPRTAEGNPLAGREHPWMLNFHGQHLWVQPASSHCAKAFRRTGAPSACHGCIVRSARTNNSETGQFSEDSGFEG